MTKVLFILTNNNLVKIYIQFHISIYLCSDKYCKLFLIHIINHLSIHLSVKPLFLSYPSSQPTICQPLCPSTYPSILFNVHPSIPSSSGVETTSHVGHCPINVVNVWYIVTKLYTKYMGSRTRMGQNVW